MTGEKLPKVFASFMEETRIELESHGVEVILPMTAYVALPGGLECNGYFDDLPRPILACGIGKSIADWMPVYIHEYCHFTQWHEQIPEWVAMGTDIVGPDEDLLDLWLTGKRKFKKSVIKKYIEQTIAIEADCERRAVKLIREKFLPIDTDKYSQQANSYVHFYNYIHQNRKWYQKGKEPYRIEKVWSQFSTEINDDFDISWEYMDLYEKYCF